MKEKREWSSLETPKKNSIMVLPPPTDKFTKDFPSNLKICVTGAGGFIASHLAKRLKEEGHFVRAVDWKENEYMAEARAALTPRERPPYFPARDHHP